MGSCCLYGFDRQRAFRAKYMAKNLSASQEYRKYDENKAKHKDNVATKSKWKAQLPIGFHG